MKIRCPQSGDINQVTSADQQHRRLRLDPKSPGATALAIPFVVNGTAENRRLCGVDKFNRRHIDIVVTRVSDELEIKPAGWHLAKGMT